MDLGWYRKEKAVEKDMCVLVWRARERLLRDSGNSDW